jgi:four helix bundle protein
MVMSDPSQSVQRFKVWQPSVDLVVLCHGLSGGFPADERFGLVSQIRQAATSIPANIAEGFGRWNAPEFSHFLAIASGSSGNCKLT